MPWETRDLKTMREEFVRLALQPGVNKRELMRRFGISPPTAYKWLKRFELGGVDALVDRSRRPKRCPRQSDAQLEAQVLALRERYPYWGGRKLAQVLRNEGAKHVPAPSTITAILRRHGKLLSIEDGVGSGPCQRFERAGPNELWQMDFKGDFALHDRKRCYPLTACDDHSRYNLVLEPCANQKSLTVQAHLQRAFERYGLPLAILCDNGPPWTSNWASYTYSQLEVWLMLLGIRVLHGRPYHPQTQGKEERFHRTLNVELLRRVQGFRDLAHCQQLFDQWRQVYNWHRPHEALAMAVPGARYQSSPRSMPKRPDAQAWYLEEDERRRVLSNGIVEFRSRRLWIGEAFAGQVVALRERADNHWAMWFASHPIAIYDLNQAPQGKSTLRPQCVNHVSEQV